MPFLSVSSKIWPCTASGLAARDDATDVEAIHGGVGIYSKTAPCRHGLRSRGRRLHVKVALPPGKLAWKRPNEGNLRANQIRCRSPSPRFWIVNVSCGAALPGTEPKSIGVVLPLNILTVLFDLCRRRSAAYDKWVVPGEHHPRNPDMPDAPAPCSLAESGTKYQLSLCPGGLESRVSALPIGEMNFTCWLGGDCADHEPVRDELPALLTEMVDRYRAFPTLIVAEVVSDELVTPSH